MKRLVLDKLSNWQKKFYSKRILYYVGFEADEKSFYKTKKEALKKASEIMENLNPNLYIFNDRTL